MPYTPEDIEAAVEDVRQTLLRWAYAAKRGDVRVVVGENDLQVEEHDVTKHPRIKRARSGQSVVEKVR